MHMLIRATRRSNCCSRASRTERLMSWALATGSGGDVSGEVESASGGREVARSGRGDGMIEIEPWGEIWDANDPVEEGDRFEDLGL